MVISMIFANIKPHEELVLYEKEINELNKGEPIRVVTKSGKFIDILPKKEIKVVFTFDVTNKDMPTAYDKIHDYIFESVILTLKNSPFDYKWGFEK